MAEIKVTFTKEHQERLNTLVLDALYNKTQFKHTATSVMTVYDLLHNCSLNTLSTFQKTAKKQADEIDDLDEFSMTDYQRRKQNDLRKNAELFKLLVGYVRYNQQVEADKAKLAELKKTYNELKESSKTPEDRLKELESQIAAMEA